jgi:hypothetical protein
MNAFAPKPAATLKIAHVMAAVAHAWEIEPRQLKSQSRVDRIVEARFAVAHLARRLTAASFPMIGKALGQADHSTAHYGAARMAERLSQSEEARLRYQAAELALQIVERAGLAHLLDAIDAVAVARRIEARPERYAAMATAHEITAMAQWIVDMAGPDDAPTPAFPTTSADPTTETDHAA